MYSLESWCVGPIATHAYLLTSEGESVAIDAPPGSASHLRAATRLLVTHSHWDHIADCAELGLPVSIHAEDIANLRSPGVDGLPAQCPPFAGVEPDHLLVDGEQIPVGALTLEVVHTPGHSPGSVCFYCASEGFLFVGDTIFPKGTPPIKVPTEEPERMAQTLERLAELPPETKIYPGHGPVTTIGKELGDVKWLHS